MIEPQIFISAVSSEFGSIRTIVALVLTRLGFKPVAQETLGTEPGDLRQVLREKIDRCEGLIHLVGHGFGMEPPAETEFGRVSYTQYEFLYARSKGKKTWLILVDEDCARDTPIAELDLPDEPRAVNPQDYQIERRALQDAYREARQSDGHLYYSVSSVDQIQINLNELRDELDALRKEQRDWQASVSAKLSQLASERAGSSASARFSTAATRLKSPRVWVPALILLFAAAVFGRGMTARISQTDRTAIATESPDLKILVASSRQDTFRSLAEAAPLESGSVLQVRFRIPAGVEAALCAVNGVGHLRPLQHYAAQDRARPEYWPERDRGVTLLPPAGTEFVFLCGRKGSVSTDELQAFWGPAADWPQLNEPRLILKATPEGIEEVGERSRDFGAEVDLSNLDSIRLRLDRFRERLAAKYSLFEGVAFRHTGEHAEPQSRDVPAPSGSHLEGARHALLVGVTKYDNLATGVHLAGPANDVKLVRSTLIAHFGFHPEDVTSLTEDERNPALRPTRANIAREFKRLAEKARAGDQVVVLLAGHGDRQPESDPPSAAEPEPDGIDEIFLPADVKPWQGNAERVPNAIADKEIRAWLRAITAKKVYVWAIFDCCHSATMNRDAEAVRQLPPGVLVPSVELAKARQRAARRTSPAPDEGLKGQANAGAVADDYLVSSFACREFERTPESPQPAESSRAEWHGLFTYSLMSVLQQSAASGSPVTYRELLQRVQASYLTRPQSAPTPTVDGAGQDRVVLGTERPDRPKMTLTRIDDGYQVNVGDLHGITRGSILRVYSPAGKSQKPQVLGHVQVKATRPLSSLVAAVAYDGIEKPSTLPATGLCDLVVVNYPMGPVLVGIDPGVKGPGDLKQAVMTSLQALPNEEAGIVQIVDDLRTAHFLVRMAAEGPELQVASGNRPPIALPPLGDETFGSVLAKMLTAIYRAHSLIEVGIRLERERSRGPASQDVTIDVVSHHTKDDPGQVIERPSTGWVFRPGDRISFRITNTSKTKRLEVTLLIVDPDYQIHLFYPAKNQVNKALEPGATFNTAAGTITDEPPFGPEKLVAIITSPTNPPVDYGLLTQPGVRRRGDISTSPVAELLERALRGAGARSGLTISELEDQTAKVLSWRTERARK
jgi:uncharacterized caspase-like protein